MKRTVILIIALFLLIAIGGGLLFHAFVLQSPEDSITEDVEEIEVAPQPEEAPPPAATPAYQTITAAEGLGIMESGEPFILLDVRAQSEFEEGHIAGAILIPDQELVNRALSELPDQDLRILIYCRSGRRSAEAARALAALGYTNVYDMGGILDWPYEVVR